ncbi:MAG TPA: hypothetical protein VKB66_06720 [Candidatus Acidoferrum sp.]|nr:hypothetical protein [Candidatus Acidoferrum sp.]
MKSAGVCALLLLGSAIVAQAQVDSPTPVFDTDNAAPDFSTSSAAKATLPDLLAVTDALVRGGLTSVPHLSTALSAGPASADSPAPSPKPRFVYGGRDDYRWQLGLSLAWVHFNSSAFSANAIGIKTSVSYFLNQWLGVEGNVTAAFSPTTLGTDHVKIALYGGGPKVAWRQKRWEPWLHGIFGGAHVLPQTAAGSRSTYSIMAGGGADYRWNPHLSFRAEGDYVRTAFFNQTQNNFQLAGGAVLHF